MRLTSITLSVAALLAATALAQAPTPAPKPVTPPAPVVVDPAPVDPKPESPKPDSPKSDSPKPNGDGAQDPAPANRGSTPQDPASRPSGKDPAQPVESQETQVKNIPAAAPEDLPAGLDPADIAAMKSAQAMLEAEAKLKKLLAEGKLGDLDRILTFEELSSWPYEDGLTGMPAPVRKLDGQKVMMTGFMLPIDEVEGIKEFLLVQSLWACCYGQPPDIHGIVRVVMKGKSRIDYQFDPVKIVGDFKVEAAYEDGYCLDIYQLHADSVEAIR